MNDVSKSESELMPFISLDDIPKLSMVSPTTLCFS